MTILQYQDDHFEQVNDDDVMAVITIILQEPQRKEKLKVHWIPHKMTRQGFIFFTRMQGFCDRLEVLCTVYHNGLLWPDESSLKRHMQNGDHLRLQIRSSCYLWSDFEFVESLERRRRLFGSSSDGDRETPHDSERSRPSGHRSERSRSRDRQGGYGDGSESESLLQIGWTLQKAPIQEQEYVVSPRCWWTCSGVMKLYQALGCHYRCILTDHTCVTTVNFETPPPQCSLTLEDGDSCIGKLTEVGIHTEDNLDLRSDAASEDARMSPHSFWTWTIDNSRAPVVLLQTQLTFQWQPTRTSATTLHKNYSASGLVDFTGYSDAFVYQTFTDLPPPGNGTLVDLRRDLDAMDDITIHEWGECCFDFHEQEATKITSVSMSLPQLRHISDYICGAALPTMPTTFLYDYACELPEACQAEVDSLSIEPPDNPVYRRVYTDGSYDSHAMPTIRVGWGFAVFLCGVDCTYLEHMALWLH